MTDDALVDAFANACLKAGQSNSGLCISAGADSDWKRMQEIRKQLKERLKQLATDPRLTQKGDS